MTEPPIYQGACPYCASAISTVTRDGFTYARCSHRRCGGRGPLHRDAERAVDLFTRGKWSIREVKPFEHISKADDERGLLAFVILRLKDNGLYDLANGVGAILDRTRGK